MDLAKKQADAVNLAYLAFADKLTEANTLDLSVLENDCLGTGEAAAAVNDIRVRLRELYKAFGSALNNAASLTTSIADPAERTIYFEEVDLLLRGHNIKDAKDDFDEAIGRLNDIYRHYTNDKTIDVVDDQAAIDVEEDSVFNITPSAGDTIDEAGSTVHYDDWSGASSRADGAAVFGGGQDVRAVADKKGTAFPPHQESHIDPFAAIGYAAMIAPKARAATKSTTPPLNRNRSRSVTNAGAAVLDILGSPNTSCTNGSQANTRNVFINSAANVAMSVATATSVTNAVPMSVNSFAGSVPTSAASAPMAPIMRGSVSGSSQQRVTASRHQTSTTPSNAAHNYAPQRLPQNFVPHPPVMSTTQNYQHPAVNYQHAAQQPVFQLPSALNTQIQMFNQMQQQFADMMAQMSNNIALNQNVLPAQAVNIAGANNVCAGTPAANTFANSATTSASTGSTTTSSTTRAGESTIDQLSALLRRDARITPLEVPNFDGTPERFNDWWSTFKYAVHDNVNMDGGEKLMRLKLCTSGIVAAMISPFEINAESYAECIRLIEKRFLNTMDVRHRAMERLHSLKESGPTHTELRATYVAISSNLAVLKRLENCDDSTWLLKIITAKFPSWIRRKITRELGRVGAAWKLSLILDKIEAWIVEKEYEVAYGMLSPEKDSNAMSVNSMAVADYSSGKFRSRQPYRSDHTSRSSSFARDRSVPATAVAAADGSACGLCMKPGHHAVNCRSIKSAREKGRLAREAKLCYVCLSANHYAADCSGPNCSTCQKHHHTSLCQVAELATTKYPRAHTPLREAVGTADRSTSKDRSASKKPDFRSASSTRRPQ